MRGYTLDTNIVTAYLKRHPLVRQRIRQAESAGHPVMLNAVSYYETKRGLLFADAQTQMRLFEQLWRSQGIIMLDQAALIGKNLSSLSDFSRIIAAQER